MEAPRSGHASPDAPTPRVRRRQTRRVGRFSPPNAPTHQLTGQAEASAASRSRTRVCSIPRRLRSGNPVRAQHLERQRVVARRVPGLGDHRASVVGRLELVAPAVRPEVPPRDAPVVLELHDARRGRDRRTGRDRAVAHGRHGSEVATAHGGRSVIRTLGASTGTLGARRWCGARHRTPGNAVARQRSRPGRGTTHALGPAARRGSTRPHSGDPARATRRKECR